VLAALALARSGDSGPAEKMASELARGYPMDTLINDYWLPTIRASIEIDRGNPARAVDFLRSAQRYELGQPPQGADPLYPVYVRAEAFRKARRGAEATAEFQKILSHRGIMQNSPLGALARLGLARSLVLQGDPAKARAAYQNFLALWKDAGPGVPILAAAQSEYARLN
jgi:ATP/maltotriose-dependent transcriptional regulator MalT